MKKNNNKSKVIFVIIITIMILLNIYILIFNYKATKSLLDIKNKENNTYLDENKNYTAPSLNITNDPLSTEGFTRVNISIKDKSIVLQNNCTALGLVTNDIQLYSIKEGLEKAIDLRPTIHDTTRAILDNFNISLILIKIIDAKDDLYFSNIYLKNGNNILNIDAKPSDSIALAVRTNTPVYVKNSVMEKYGGEVC